MMLADTLLRGAAMAAALMIATVMLATPSARRAGWSAFAVAVTSTGYLLASAPFSASLAPGPGGVAVLGAILLPVAFTWLVTEIFLDASRDRKLWLWLASATVPLALAATRFPGAGLLRGALLLLLYLSLLYVAMVTARGDLVERRRQFRPAFLGVMAALGVVITMTELAGWNDPLPPSSIRCNRPSFLACQLPSVFGPCGHGMASGPRQTGQSRIPRRDQKPWIAH